MAEALNQVLDAAVSHLGAGQAQPAELLCRQILARNPRHAAALNMLGIIAQQGGDGAAAIDYLEQAVAAKPNYGDAYFNLANARMARGLFVEAAAAYRECLELQPKDAVAHAGLGNALLSQGDWPNAAVAFRAALLLAPDHTEALNKLGYVLKQQGEYDEAAALLARALKIQPQSAEAENNLGTVLRAQRKFGAAQRAFRNAIALRADFVEAHNNLGHTLFDLGDVEGALAVFKRALDIRPGDLDTLINLAGIGERANRLSVARDACEQGLALDPANPTLHLIAAQCERRAGEIENAIQRLAPIDLGQVPPRLAIDIGFELGRLYDRAGNTKQAFGRFEAANRASADFPPHRAVDGKGFLALTDAMEKLITPAWRDSWSEAPAMEAYETPTFLVGFPRSGTTLTEQILASHPALATLDETPTVDAMMAHVPGYPAGIAALTPAQITSLRQLYFEAAAKHADVAGGRRLIDKMPLNIVHAALVLRVFPEARFVLVLRHPCDAVLSCFMQNFVINASMANFFTLAESAAFYAKTMALWRHTARVFAVPHHVVRYENLVGDFENEVRGLLEFVGVPWDAAVADFAENAKARGKILTPSYHQVTEPLYTRALGRWKSYETELAGVAEKLKPFVTEFGYTW